MTEQELLIEEAQLEDAASLAQLLREVPGESDFLAQDEQSPYLSTSDLETYISRHAELTNNLCLVAKLGNKVIGVLNVTADQGTKTSHIGDIFIAVSKTYWGYGIGRFLMEAMLDWADHTPEMSRLELTVQARNDRAVHLYQQFGFEIEGTKKRGARTADGAFLDVYLMAKLID